MNIFALFHSFCQVYSVTMLRQLSDIIAGALCAPHHITMRNIARWSTYSYRTVQRFFNTPIHWPSLHTAFVTTHVYEKSHTFDGHFGNIPTLEIVQRHGLHIITKLRADSVLYLPLDTPYSGRGRPKIFSEKVDVRNLSTHYYVQATHDGDTQIQLFQCTARVKASTQLLNIVVRKTTQRTKKTATYTILMCSDLALTAVQLVDYYRLRFQIEFNFRDAKQHFGLEDFMNVTATAVNNAANLAMCMVNVSTKLIADSGGEIQGVRDLKTVVRGRKYVAVVLKLLPQKLHNELKSPIDRIISILGRINAPPNDQRAA